MRKNRVRSNDSLDLLLDTLCNVFGGIILIACLLALITQDKKGPPVGVFSASEGQLLERRIESANDEISGLKQLLAELDREGDSNLRRLAAERDALRETLDRLRDDKMETAKQSEKETKNAFLDPGKELTTLKHQVQLKQRELEAAKSRINATTAKLGDVTDRLARLQGAIRESEANRVVKLRFPKERMKTKGAIPVIIQHGQIYPVSENFPGLEVTRLRTDGIQVVTQPGRGWSLLNQAKAIRDLIDECKLAGGYLTIYVYRDSFETFRELKTWMHDAGCEYGVEVWEDEVPLRFGTKGRAPAPL